MTEDTQTELLKRLADDFWQRIVDEAGARVLRPDEVPAYIEAKARGFVLGMGEAHGSEAKPAEVAKAQAHDAGPDAGKLMGLSARHDKQGCLYSGLKRALEPF